MAKPHPKTCHTQILQLFSTSDSFYDSNKQIPLIETPLLPLMLLYLCFSPWVSDLGTMRPKGGANMRPLKKFNFSFSSTLMFFENRSLIQNVSEIGTLPLIIQHGCLFKKGLRAPLYLFEICDVKFDSAVVFCNIPN